MKALTTASVLGFVAAGVAGTSLGLAAYSRGGIDAAAGAAGVASLIALGAAITSRRAVSTDEQQLKLERDAARGDRTKLDTQRAEIEQFKDAVSAQLTQRARQLDERALHLANRQANFREWLEYPQAADSNESPFSNLSPHVFNDKDRRVMEIIEAEAKLVYQKLREGHYKPADQLDGKMIRDEVHDFILRVAKVYQPDSKNPLMETSVDQLLRAGSRACLHLLVVLERLPLKAKDHTISALYGYVQKALKAYDAYSAAQPYFGYVQTASYVGRWLAGVSPLTLGISWAVTELGKRGTKAAAHWLIDQQAVSLLHEVVRVIGFEVASIYGGDFRHRDPNWVFAAELTNLMSRFPVSRENLAQSLKEVGALPFRNEYDRIYLYRCLSAHRAPEPLVAAGDVLPLPDRQQLVRRIERFFLSFIHGKTRSTVDEWRTGFESRLGLRLTLPDATAERSTELPALRADRDQMLAIRALAAFLISFKASPIDQLTEQLSLAGLFSKLDAESQARFVDGLRDDPPLLFEPPDIDAASPLVPLLIADLCRLSVRTRPWDVQVDELVLETGVFLGQDYAKTKKLLEREYVDALASQFARDAITSKVDPLVARALLAELRPDEQLRFVYAGASITWPTDIVRPDGDRKAGLLGTSTRLIAVEASDRGALIASHPNEQLGVEKVSGLVLDDCCVTGKQWVIEGVEGPKTLVLQLSGSMGSRFDSHFQPLLEIVRS